MTNLTAYRINEFSKTNGFVNIIYTLYYNYNAVDGTYINSEEFNYVIHEEKLTINSIYNIITGITESVTLKQGNQTVFRATVDMYSTQGGYYSIGVLYQYLRDILVS